MLIAGRMLVQKEAERERGTNQKKLNNRNQEKKIQKEEKKEETHA